MHKVSRFARIDVAVAGLIAGLAAATPAFAALPFELPFTASGLPMRDWILMGSLVLLAVALAIRLMRHRRSNEPLTDTTDLRWWRNS
jgi:hypothetical protein